MNKNTPTSTASYENHCANNGIYSHTFSPEAIALHAQQCLCEEINTWPKPGLVSHIDNGSHTDMNADTFYASANAIGPYLAQMVHAGYANENMSTLRQIGIQAEQAMLNATAGVNTHRGAIFGLGLLCAAIGIRQRQHHATANMQLGEIVSFRWGNDILNRKPTASPLTSKTTATTLSHGQQVRKNYGAGGACEEAFYGFPSVYQVGLTAYKKALQWSADNLEAARIHTCFALIAQVEDTNLLHRGGIEGLTYAQNQAQHFLNQGSIQQPNWLSHAKHIHHEFIARNLSPGGTADLLCMTLFIHAHEHANLL